MPIQSQAAPAAPARPVDPGVMKYYQLKAREKELNNQIEEATDRRNELAGQLEGRTGADRTGIEGRLAVIDQRLAQLEIDQTSLSKDIREAAPASLGVPQPPINRGASDEDLAGAGFTGAGIMLVVLLIPYLWRRRWRRRNPSASMQAPALPDARIDRMENSIDAIAVEIERISENQRFMTRLMTETQLAGTLAAVRDSADAAKTAVEKG